MHLTVDSIASVADTEAVVQGTEELVKVEGLLTQLVIEIEKVLGSITRASTGGKEVADVLTEIVELVDGVVEVVEGALDVGEYMPRLTLNVLTLPDHDR